MPKQEEKTKCKCPYCDSEMPISQDLCDICKIRFIECTNCGQRFTDKLEKCPKCGEVVKHG